MTHQGASPHFPLPSPPRKKPSVLPWVIGIVVALVILGLTAWMLWPDGDPGAGGNSVIRGLHNEPKHAWSLELDGSSHISGDGTAAGDGTLIFIGRDPTKPLRMVDPDTGKDIWTREIRWPQPPPTDMHPSVRWGNDVMLVEWRTDPWDGEGIFALVDRETGETRDTGKADAHQDWKLLSDDDLLWVEAKDGRFRAHRAESFDGEPAWTVSLDVEQAKPWNFSVVEPYALVDRVDGAEGARTPGDRYVLDLGTGEFPKWWEEGPAYARVGDYFTAFDKGKLSLIDAHGTTLWSDVEGAALIEAGGHYFILTEGERGAWSAQLVDIESGEMKWDAPLSSPMAGRVESMLGEMYLVVNRMGEWNISRIDMARGELTEAHTASDVPNAMVYEGQGQILFAGHRDCHDSRQPPPRLIAFRPGSEEPAWKVTTEGWFFTFGTRNMYDMGLERRGEACVVTSIARLK